MRIDDAEQLVVAEWTTWLNSQYPSKTSATGTDALIFFGYLQQSRSDLLSFQCSGDKWQRVHGWLLKRRLVSN